MKAGIMINEVYNRLPESAKPFAKSIYRTIKGSDSPTDQGEFIREFFESERGFKNYSSEFDDSIAKIQSDRMDEYYEMVPDDQATFGGINIEQARSLYAIVRSERPGIIVETGVCNGVTTLIILKALENNQSGYLYSIDYPTYSNDPIAEFQEMHYPDDHTFSAIPSDKMPGWIVPDDLRDRWELRKGKSQRHLPSLLDELSEIDIFLHDSDHTFPCMMFEYEVAWEYLKSNGLLLSDDIHTNDAFTLFGEIRACQYGEVCPGFGYALKDKVTECTFEE